MLSPIFRRKILHRTRQDERNDTRLDPTIPIFDHRSLLMKATPAAAALAFLLAANAAADPAPCILTLHSAVTPQLIIINAECPPLATQVTIYNNDDPLYRVTLPPPLNARPGNLVFIVDVLPGINQFSATSNDVAPEPGNPPDERPH